MEIVKKVDGYIYVSISHEELKYTKNIQEEIYELVGENYIIIEMHDDPLCFRRVVVLKPYLRGILFRKFDSETNRKKEILFRKF